MKNIYLQFKSERLALSLLKSVLPILFLTIFATDLFAAASVSGTSKCEGGTLAMGVNTPVKWNVYALYRLNPDNTWDFLEDFASGGANINFNTYTAVGKYLVYQYPIGSDSPPEPGPGDFLVGHLWIFAEPSFKTLEITGTENTDFTISVGGKYVFCDKGAVQIDVETLPNQYDNSWDVTYELYKEADLVSAQTAGSGTLYWTDLVPGVYTIKARRGVAAGLTCNAVNMTGSLTIDKGLIKNESRNLCYLTLKESVDGSTLNNNILIPDGSYDEVIDVVHNLTFTCGTFTIGQTLTVDGGVPGAVLTLAGNMVVTGALTLTAAGDKIDLDAGINTLTLNGDWGGDGSLVVDESSSLVLGEAGAVSNFNLEGTALNNLTIEGGIDNGLHYHGITMLNNLTIHGTLSLADAYDELVLGGNKLTLLGGVDAAGAGVILGDNAADLEVSGSGGTTSMFVFGDLDELKIDRTEEVVTVDAFGGPMSVNTLTLAAGSLDLSDQAFKVVGTYTKGATGDFTVNAGTTLEFDGTTEGTLMFASSPATLSKLILGTTRTLTVGTAIANVEDVVVTTGHLATAAGKNLTAGTITLAEGTSLETGADLTADILSNIGSVTLGGTTIISDQLTMGETGKNATLNFTGHSLTLGGEIVVSTGSTFTASATSDLILSGGNAAWDLPAIPVLNNLTIARSFGVNMTGGLDIQGGLTLTSGDFTIGGNTLKIKNPILPAIPTGVLVGSGASVLHIAENTGNINIPALSLGELIVDHSGGVTLDGFVNIFSKLTLLNGIVTNTDLKNLVMQDATTIERRNGILAAEPDFDLTATVKYKGGAAIDIGFELPAGNGVTVDVEVDNTNHGVTLKDNRMINNLTLTNGGFNFDGKELTLTGALATTTGSLTANNLSDLVLNGVNAFTVPASIDHLRNLVVNRTGPSVVVGLAGDLIVDQDLTLTAGNFALGANMLTIKNNIKGTPANLVAGSSSSVTIAGTDDDIIIPAHITALDNLSLENGNGTVLQNELTLSSLTLTDGLLTLGTHNLSTDAVSGGSSDSYVIAPTGTGNGILTVTGTNSTKLPIGYSDAYYTPLTITNVGATNLSATVAYVTGMDGFTSPVPSPNYVKLRWEITNTSPVNASVKFEWNTGEDFNAEPTLPVVGRLNGTDWVEAGTISTFDFDNRTITATGIGSFSSFAIYGDLLDEVYVNDAGDDLNTGENEDNAPSGTGPKATITAALKAVVHSGGKLIIADGTSYDETVDLTFPVTFQGATTGTGTFTIGQTLTVDGGVPGA
ncbi:MAG: beta strand repeat-containing protein, partial [Bacteroidales bacterium]